MSTFAQTRSSGTKFERQLLEVLRKYSTNVWSNVRIETVLTVKGYTEVDLICCVGDVILVIEAKNVSTIIGEYADKNWQFIGSKAPMREVKEYTALNVITQNNIHLRSIKDCFFAYFHVWPKAYPLIVVPNGCKVSRDISGYVHTVDQLEQFLSSNIFNSYSANVHRRLAGIILGDDYLVERPDFVRNPSGTGRIKQSI